LGLPRGLGGWPIQWNYAKCCGADPSCHGNEISARRGNPVAYRLVGLVLFVVILGMRFAVSEFICIVNSAMRIIYRSVSYLLSEQFHVTTIDKICKSYQLLLH